MSVISRSKVWVTGDVLTASDLNGEFNVIFNDYNGSIDENNIGTITGPITWSVTGSNRAQTITNAGTGDTIRMIITSTGPALVVADS